MLRFLGFRSIVFSRSSLQAAFQQAAALSGAAAAEPATTELDPGVIVVPMPSLSHSMVSGRVTRWLKQEGDVCQQYDLLLEIETDSLVEEAYKVDDFAGTTAMLIETQEDACVAKLLVPEGQEVAVGTPIAVLCDSEDQLQLAAAQATAVEKVQNVYSISEEAPMRSLRTLEWQSYLKESSKGPGDDCGCM